MRPGLLSITFRQYSPQQIIDLCVTNRLQTIEWGGDVHVPHGDLAAAAEVGKNTRRHGLDVTAYGSYYELAASPANGLEFASVLDTAVALETKAIRVWAGNRGSALADAAFRQAVIDDALRCADLAATKGILICYEYHIHTLTDTLESACKLLAATEHPFIKALWQPTVGATREECLAGLRRLAPRLHHVHAFHWWPDYSQRHPLRDGEENWSAYVAELRAHGYDPDILLEFVVGDDPASLTDDALFLNELLDSQREEHPKLLS
ncbi:MAG: sugar phosphate isomerase/epimerase family protein [Verrucomicrobiota bacterium]